VLCFCFLELGIRPSVFTEFKLNQVNFPLVWIQFLVFSKLLVLVATKRAVFCWQCFSDLALIVYLRICSDSLSAACHSVWCSQLWGIRFMHAGREFSSLLSTLHLHFLKGMLGVKQSTTEWAILRECGYELLQFYWFQSAVNQLSNRWHAQ
jgi:hypothetical protein